MFRLKIIRKLTLTRNIFKTKLFLERKGNRKQSKGWIEVICGSMFSGKTEELIRRMKRAEFAKQKVEIFKPAIDIRYHEEDVVSHEGNAMSKRGVGHKVA